MKSDRLIINQPDPRSRARRSTTVNRGKDNGQLNSLRAITRAGDEERLAVARPCRSDQHIPDNVVALEDEMFAATEPPGDQGPRIAVALDTESPSMFEGQVSVAPFQHHNALDGHGPADHCRVWARAGAASRTTNPTIANQATEANNGQWRTSTP